MFPPREDSFTPDSFISDEGDDSFIADSFTPEEEEEESSIWKTISRPLWEGPSRFARQVSEYFPQQDILHQRLNEIIPGLGTTAAMGQGFGRGALEGIGDLASGLTSPINLVATALTGGAAGTARVGLTALTRLLTAGARTSMLPVIGHGGSEIYEGLQEGDLQRTGFGLAETAGGLAGLRYKPTVRQHEILPPEPPTIRGLLPERTPDPFIVGEAGIAHRESLLTPQERMRLQGVEIGPEGPIGRPGEPRGTTIDLGELAEQRRQEGLSYTDLEQAGGRALELERPIMDIPPESGDIRLGFRPETSPAESLGYPLDIVPNVLRPRTAQTVTRALAGEEFARPIEEGPRVRFESEQAPEAPIELAPQRDIMGGTAALTPEEPILPSAPKRTRVAPHIQEQQIDNSYEQKVANYTAKNIEPAMPGATESVKPIIAQNQSVWRRLADGLMISGERQLERMGEVGTEIRRVLSSTEYSKRELFNQFADPFIKSTEALRPEEIQNFVESMDGTAKPLTPNVANAVIQARSVTDAMGMMAEQAGVHVKTPSGKVVPFKGLKEYWPHRPVQPIARGSFIDELIRNNPKLSRSQAERLAKQFQNESEFFNSPQHSRMFGKFEYRKDLNAMIDHIADMADIISRAKILGPGDIGNRSTMISRLIEKAPDPVRANELVRTHLRGGLDKNDSFYQAVKTANRVATKVQVFTKLGLFPISNLNNQLQTMLHGNLNSFAQAFGQAISGSPTLKSLAKEYGTVSVGELPVGILSEAGKRQVPVVGPLVKWAEDFARLVSTGTGKGTAEAVFKTAKSRDRQSVKRLQNLLLEDDLTDVLKQNRLNPEQLKFATQRFVELAQQLDSGIKLPPAWVNEPLLHIPLIFKRFGFQGTKSIKDALMSNPRRNIPLFLVASPLLGELTGDLKSVVYGVIRGAPAPDGMLEAIAFELAGRHKFAERITGLDTEGGDIEWLANRLTADILQSWGLGLVADMMQGALGGKNAGYSALFGPAIDQALSVITGIGQMDVKSLGREGLRSLPVVGPGLQRRFLPTPSQEME